MQAYGTNNTFSWTPTAADAGSYTVMVLVRNAGSTASYRSVRNFCELRHYPVTRGGRAGVINQTPKDVEYRIKGRALGGARPFLSGLLR